MPNGTAWRPGRRAAGGCRRRRPHWSSASWRKLDPAPARSRPGWASSIVVSCTRPATRTHNVTQSTMPTSEATCTRRRAGMSLYNFTKGSSRAGARRWRGSRLAPRAHAAHRHGNGAVGFRRDRQGQITVKVGIPSEVKNNNEFRVGITPVGVTSSSAAGTRCSSRRGSYRVDDHRRRVRVPGRSYPRRRG